MNSIYNTSFELSLRVLLILEAAGDKAETADTLAAIDFITVYGKHFNISVRNLHGDNPFMLSEFALRREVVAEAIRSLVRKGLIEVQSSNEGFSYRINKVGLDYCTEFTSSYSREYRETTKRSRLLFASNRESALIDLTHECPVTPPEENGEDNG